MTPCNRLLMFFDEPAARRALAPGYVVVEHVRRGEDLDSYEAWSVSRSARRQLARAARLLVSACSAPGPRLRLWDAKDGQPLLLILETSPAQPGATCSRTTGGRALQSLRRVSAGVGTCR